MPWLMKAEPDSRIVKGKDVKFSVDDFEELGTSPWDGVRSHEAKNIMKEKMKLGDKVLFYHSNTKVPGVFAIAEVAKEGYPDYTAWDPSHPYFDPKSSQDNPTWYMVSVKFIRRLSNPVTLSFVKSLIGASAPPKGIEYIGNDGLKAIQSMALVNRGRLSVQPVEEDAYAAIVALGDKGGFVADAKASNKKTPAKRVKDEDSEDEPAPPKKAKAATKEKKTATEKKPATKKEPAPKKTAKETKPVSQGSRRSPRQRDSKSELDS